MNYNYGESNNGILHDVVVSGHEGGFCIQWFLEPIGGPTQASLLTSHPHIGSCASKQLIL